MPIKRRNTTSGDRHAILFAGSGDLSTLNGLEYCYRMLIHQYRFKRDHIVVLYFVGERKLNGGEQAKHWPAASSADEYEIEINKEGTREKFQTACNLMKQKLGKDDLLFIHMNGHGDADSESDESFVLEKGGGQYFAKDFCEDLATLGEYESLLIMMQQCFSGGFIGPILKARKDNKIMAKCVSIACASGESAFKASDGLFDCFSRDWISAHLNADPFGNALPKKADTSGNGFIEAGEAYDFAKLVQDPDDDPVQGNHPAKKSKLIRLG